MRPMIERDALTKCLRLEFTPPGGRAMIPDPAAAGARDFLITQIWAHQFKEPAQIWLAIAGVNYFAQPSEVFGAGWFSLEPAPVLATLAAPATLQVSRACVVWVKGLDLGRRRPPPPPMSLPIEPDPPRELDQCRTCGQVGTHAPQCAIKGRKY